MSTDPTLPQGGQERQRALEMSLHQEQPPTQVPGYEPERFLGMGAYGEVWVAIERNTGRRVAIKFYTHRGGLDWSLLSREVEKLAFLFADRYVVQLIGVGWEAEPPYYIMEYLEHGSLAERLQTESLSVAAAVDLFRDVAIGLGHAHAKGVLHCDLKPANILLDQDNKPRLADFGQSRLSHEQTPALGTLFYMAPEQADLAAVPDVQWDVYALGALLYSMIVGEPPYRTAELVEQLERAGDLPQRLAAYRRGIRGSPLPVAHRQTPGVDRHLAEIIERCVAPDPARRYPNVQAVLDALDARASRRARRPLMILGAVGPALVLLVVSLFAWSGFGALLARSNEAFTENALENNSLMADYVAGVASKELARRCDAVEQVASLARLHAMAKAVETSGLSALSKQLADPPTNGEALEALREQFREHPLRKQLQAGFDELLPSWMRPPQNPGTEGEVLSWFFCDTRGVSVFRVSSRPGLEKKTVGKNYAWRSYFHGGSRDYEESWRPAPGQHVTQVQLSAVYRSQANGFWIVAVSSPVVDSDTGRFLGVVALTVRVTRFVELRGDDDQFAVLVEWRDGDHKGLILQHRLYDKLQAEGRNLPEHFQNYRLRPEDLPTGENAERQRRYRDPITHDPEGQAYNKHWLAQMEPVRLHQAETGWVVIVQKAYDSSIGSILDQLKAGLVSYSLAALGMVVMVVLGLWGLAIRLWHEPGATRPSLPGGPATQRDSGTSKNDSPPGGQTRPAPSRDLHGN